MDLAVMRPLKEKVVTAVWLRKVIGTALAETEISLLAGLASCVVWEEKFEWLFAIFFVSLCLLSGKYEKAPLVSSYSYFL
jgi:hypothetical protein